MLQDVHSRKVSIPVSAAIGDTVVVAGTTDRWLYVHEILGDLATTGTLSVVAKTGTGERILGTYNLDEGQGITTEDEPGEDNRPRFEFKPGEDFVLRVTGGAFTGSTHYSLRY